jgi:hypothetical protein
MNENNIKSELMKRYNGVKNVTRMFFDDEEGTPKAAVQVDFTLPDDVKKILRDGNIVIGGICRRAYAIKNPYINDLIKNHVQIGNTQLKHCVKKIF